MTRTTHADKPIQVLAIVGSPRRGNTYRICQMVAEQVAALHPHVSFEYLLIKDAHIEMCRGCQVCLLKGAEKCPLKDDVPQILQKLQAADGLILAAPGYNQHVPGLMKNWIDRMSFNCHSPSLYGKNALAIATVGGMGHKTTAQYLALIATCWGRTSSKRSASRWITCTTSRDTRKKASPGSPEPM